jgi:hypothetical protein
MAQTRKQKVLQEVKRKRKQRTIISLVIAAVLISIIGVGVYALSRNAGNAGDFPFTCLGQEYVTLHVHPWLRIFINIGTGGTNDIVPVIIPAAVGILNPGYTTTSNGVQAVDSGSCYEPMHTHDNSGIIHIESQSTSSQYTIGNFFTIWAVTCKLQPSDCVSVGGSNRPIIFNQTDILGYNPGQGHTVSFLVDGQNYTAPHPENLALNNYDYCTTTSDTSNPCYATANGPPSPSSYSTGNTLIIKYS